MVFGKMYTTPVIGMSEEARVKAFYESALRKTRRRDFHDSKGNWKGAEWEQKKLDEMVIVTGGVEISAFEIMDAFKPDEPAAAEEADVGEEGEEEEPHHDELQPKEEDHDDDDAAAGTAEAPVERAIKVTHAARSVVREQLRDLKSPIPARPDRDVGTVEAPWKKFRSAASAPSSSSVKEEEGEVKQEEWTEAPVVPAAPPRMPGLRPMLASAAKAAAVAKAAFAVKKTRENYARLEHGGSEVKLERPISGSASNRLLERSVEYYSTDRWFRCNRCATLVCTQCMLPNGGACFICNGMFGAA